MDVDAEMLRWSHTVYGVGHALYVAESINFGNLDTIVDSMRAAEAWNKTALGFESNLPVREFTEGSIYLKGSGHKEVFGRVSESIVKVLFINLAILADEIIGYLIGQTGSAVPNYLFNKIEWTHARIPPSYHWVTNGLFELVAIRNALVHGGGRWSNSTIAQLRAAGIQEVDMNVDISLSFGDLFRYRRALRTVIGELRKLAVG